MNDTGIDGYRVYLQRRDGEADLLNRRLASREELFEGLEADPVRTAHPIDRRVFMLNLRRRRPEPGVDRKMLFLFGHRQTEPGRAVRRGPRGNLWTQQRR